MLGFAGGPEKQRWSRIWSLFCTLATVLAVASVLLLMLYIAVVNGAFDESVEGKVMVVYSMQDTPFTKRQGFFAEMFAVLGALHYAEVHGAIAVRIKFNTPDYLDPERGPNWWAYFFEDTMVIDRDDDKNAKEAEAGRALIERSLLLESDGDRRAEEVHFNKYLARFGVFGSFARVLEEHKDEEHPFPLHSPGALSRLEIGDIYERYIRAHKNMTESARLFLKKYVPADAMAIGVHFRGTDKVTNWPYRSPSFETFFGLIELAIAQYKPSDYRIFIATDDDRFLSAATERYKGKVIFQQEAPRATSTDVQDLGVHKNKRFGPYIKGYSAVKDFLILSMCNFLVKNRSGLSDMAIIKNLSLPYALVMADDLIWSTTLMREDIQRVE